MTAPRGQVPRAKTSPNGRRPAGGRAGPPGPRPEVPGPEHEDIAESAAHLAGGAEAALGPGPFTGFGLRRIPAAWRRPKPVNGPGLRAASAPPAR